MKMLLKYIKNIIILFIICFFICNICYNNDSLYLFRRYNSHIIDSLIITEVLNTDNKDKMYEISIFKKNRNILKK